MCTCLGGVLLRERDALVLVAVDVISRRADLGCFSVGSVERHERRVERADDAFGNVYEDVIDLSQVVKLGSFQELQVVDDHSVFEDYFDISSEHNPASHRTLPSAHSTEPNPAPLASLIV